MNSNEEYLDSLLKAVTNGQELGTDIDTSENSTEDELILDAPEQEDEEASADVLDTVSDSDDLVSESNATEEIPSEAEVSDEEKAFSDPGALFFEGEEEAEPELDEVEEAGETEDDLVISDLEDQPADDEDASDIVNAEDTPDESMPENQEDAEGNEPEELEDLILAADSTEEVMEDVQPDSTDEEGLQEISDLLAGAGDSDDEMLAMLGGVDGAEPSDIGFFDDDDDNDVQDAQAAVEEQADASAEDTGKKKKQKKNKKGKKGAVSEEAAGADGEGNSETGSAKKGIFARFMDFLLEEDEDEEDGNGSEANIDDLLMGEATDENAAILAEIDKENEDKKEKKKKGKKGKDKKGKDKEGAEDGEEGEEGAEEKGKKAKKEKKKKEKPVKEVEPEKPTKKVSPKKIQATALFCLTITAAIILIVLLIPPSLEKQKARDAYYDKDYVKVVEGFYGEKLSESDEIMYNRAVTILKFQRKVDAYNNYMRMGKETEALNQLIEAINRYEEIYEDAVAYNIIGEIDGMYQTVLDALQNRYGLSVSRALEIYAIPDDFEYTLALESVVDGVQYAMPEPVGDTPEVQPEIPVEEQPEVQMEAPAEEQPEAPAEGETAGETPVE